MTKCQQCNSEVSGDDVFCPYCGISLQPVPIPTEDDEFASTIMMTPGTAASFAAGSISVPDQVQESVPEETDVAPAVETSVVEEAPTPQAKPQNEPIELEPPIPQILEEPKRSGEISASEFYPAAEDSPVSSEEAFPLSHEEADSTSVPISVASSEPIEDSTVLEANSDIAVQEISKPEDVLEMPEVSSGSSMFDSVRIIDEKYTPQGTRQPDPSIGREQPPNDSPSKSISNTSSGIGMVDTDGRRSAKLKPLEEGIILNGRYEIVRKIGGGGMGAVYLASDNNLGGVLRAVKEMVQAHIEEEQQVKAVEDFKRESMILSQLDHPSIPTIYDYFFDEDEGRFYLVMKYISGGDLSARLRAAPEGKVDEISVTEWGIQLADVLDYLHNQPTTIVYRDLKPSNIMIDGNSGRIMLIDFGIARSINQKEEKGVTAVGTMGYAPPELFSGNVEPRSDIYSLGSTMFHLLTGADPQSNPLLIFDFQKNPRPRQINPQLSDQIERFLMTAVEYNAASRFASAAEARAVLTEHLANLNKGAVTYGIKEAPESVGLADQPVFCGFCGQKIVATDLFCAFCGAKQPIAQKGVHSEIYGRGSATARLLVEGTSELQSPIFSLDKSEILIGRRDPMSNIFPEVDLSKYDPQTKISRRHARIWREGNTFLVEDLGSSNGTVLMPIVHESFRLAPRQPQALTNGDKIRVGDTTLHFVVN
jgi:tRNA A-37 threonylcarbamoyl transferase component Bud32